MIRATDNGKAHPVLKVTLAIFYSFCMHPLRHRLEPSTFTSQQQQQQQSVALTAETFILQAVTEKKREGLAHLPGTRRWVFDVCRPCVYDFDSRGCAADSCLIRKSLI